MSKQQVINLGFYYVNGFRIGIVDNTNASVSVGLCRDSTNVFDIVMSSSKTLNMATNGVNGLDTGTFAASNCYNVFVIADSSGFNSPAVLASLNITSPVLPGGYDIFRRVGFITSDGSTHIIVFNQIGTGSEKFYLFQDPVSILSGGTQTAFTSVSTIAVVPSILGIRVILQSAFTPAAASNTANVRAGGSLGTNGQTVTGQVTGVVLNSTIQTISKLAVEYKVSAGSLSLGIVGVVDSL
jgi:hypothetical protein